jgi:hypothetical protein
MGLAPAKTGSAEEEVFFIGADLKVRNFSGAVRRLRFGPDVFADALVPAGALPPGILIPGNPKNARPGGPRHHARKHCADGYRFAKPQGKPNSADLALARKNQRFSDSPGAPREIRSDSIHREP